MPRITNEVIVERLDNLIGEVRAQRDMFKQYSTTKEINLLLDPIRGDVQDVKQSIKESHHLVVDNTNKTDWKAVSALIVAVVGALGTIYITIKGGN